MATKIHYAGRIRTATKTVLPGWAACCSGTRAEAIRANRQNTFDKTLVTCKQCLKVIEQDAAYQQSRG